jgi:hypothetical protein
MNAEDSDQNQSDASELESMIVGLMQQVYAKRDNEEQWQAVLKNAPDKLIEFLSERSNLLSDVLVAESDEEVKALVGRVVSDAFGGIQSAKDAQEDEAAGMADAGEEKEVVAEDNASVNDSSGTSDDSGSDDDSDINDDGSDDDNDDNDDKKNKECTDEDLAAFLTLVYKNKDREDKNLADFLADASPEVLNRLDDNAFYLHKVLAMTNENEFHEFISMLTENQGPMVFTPEMLEAASGVIDEETVNMLLDNWAYIEFDCEAKNVKNEQVIESGMCEDPLQWMSTAGVGVTCAPASAPNSITVSTSLQGALHGVDANVEIENSDGSINTEVYGVEESAEKRRMLLAIDLIGFLKTTEMGDVKIRSGHRGLMRNVWAIGKVNNIVCAGFEPTPQEMLWYEKRVNYFEDQFRIELADELTQSPGMAPGGRTFSSAVDDKEHEVDMQENDEEEGQGGSEDDRLSEASEQSEVGRSQEAEAGETKEEVSETQVSVESEMGASTDDGTKKQNAADIDIKDKPEDKTGDDG